MSGGIPGYPQIAVAQRFAAPKRGTSDVGCYGSMGKLHRNQAVCTELPGFGFVVCFNPSKILRLHCPLEWKITCSVWLVSTFQSPTNSSMTNQI